MKTYDWYHCNCIEIRIIIVIMILIMSLMEILFSFKFTTNNHETKRKVYLRNISYIIYHMYPTKPQPSLFLFSIAPIYIYKTKLWN